MAPIDMELALPAMGIQSHKYHCKRTNTLRDVDICAGLGGEKFIALLPNKKIEKATVTVGRIRENFENILVLYDGGEIRFTASFGLGEWKHEK